MIDFQLSCSGVGLGFERVPLHGARGATGLPHGLRAKPGESGDVGERRGRQCVPAAASGFRQALPGAQQRAPPPPSPGCAVVERRMIPITCHDLPMLMRVCSEKICVPWTHGVAAATAALKL